MEAVVVGGRGGVMQLVVSLTRWKLSIMLTLEEGYPDLKLPTYDELKAMRKEALRRFREALEKKREGEEKPEKGAGSRPEDKRPGPPA